MGKKYDAYAQAAQAESASAQRMIEASQSGDPNKIYQAENDFDQNKGIADALWTEVTEDPEG